MSSCITYHTQIASIMEVLANAAVAEICKLVDDDYAVFRLEMSQSQKENRTLKTKLQMMELRFARERAERTMRERILNSRSGGGSRTLDRMGSNVTPRGTVEVVSDGGERIPSMDPQPSFVPQKLSDQPGREFGVQQVSGPDAVLKSEPETESVNQRLQHTGSEHTAKRLSQCLTGENLRTLPSRQGSEITTKVIPTDTDGCVPYDQIFTVSEMAEEHSLKSEPTELSTLHSAPNEMEAQGDSVWKIDAALEMGHTQPGRIIESKETEERQGYAASFRSGADAQATASGTAAAFGGGASSGHAPVRPAESSATPETAEPDHRAVDRAGRFFCSHCDKSFDRPNMLVVHQRTHTGARPYPCTQCGKTFAKSSCLKVHLRIHSGERPFVCSLCGKKFSQSFNLRVHQRVHTGERPYACGHCGMAFSHLATLNRHRRKMHSSNDWDSSR